MNYERQPVPALICNAFGLCLLVADGRFAPPYDQLAGFAGGTLIVGSIFTPAWRRAAATVRLDDTKRVQFRAMNRRLLLCLALAVVALLTLAVILRSFPVGDERLYLGIIPLVMIAVTACVAAFTAMSVRTFW